MTAIYDPIAYDIFSVFHASDHILTFALVGRRGHFGLTTQLLTNSENMAARSTAVL